MLFYVCLLLLGFKTLTIFLLLWKSMSKPTNEQEHIISFMYLVSSTTNITEMLFIILRVFQKIEITIDCGGKTLMILKLRSLNHKHHGSESQFLFFDF